MKQHPRTRGFTLIELIVSVALFATVSLIVTATYLKLIALENQTRATIDLVDNLSFALDSMERTIRTGSPYSCGSLPGNGVNADNCNQISVQDAQGCAITYTITGGTIKQTGYDQAGGGCISSGPGISIIDPRISIDSTKSGFDVSGVGSGDYNEPQIVFHITGTISPGANMAPVSFTIESSATQRNVDIP